MNITITKIERCLPENIVMEVVFENQQHLEIFIDELITYGETKTQIILSNVVAHHPIDKI